jgi:hypothetical protein
MKKCEDCGIDYHETCSDHAYYGCPLTWEKEEIKIPPAN